MSDYYGAGRLDKPAQVLDLQKTGENSWEWVKVRSIWVSADFRSRSNIFSKISVGARDASLVAWKQNITLHQAIKLGDNHLLLTAITERNRNQIDIRAAICYPIALTAKRQAQTGRDTMNRPVVEPQEVFTFPGILTELYHRNEPDGVFRTEKLQRALVTGKAIALRAGDLVQSDEENVYVVRQAMDLDPYKNEYVIERQEDV